MNRQEFLENMLDVFQRDEPLDFDMKLEDIDEWDSLAKMALVAFLDSNFGIDLTFKDLEELETVDDIAKKVGV